MSEQKIQQALVLIKPDGLKKSLTGNIITKLSEAKLVIVGAKVVRVSEKLAREHYRDVVDRPFFDELLLYIQGKLHGEPHDRVIALVYEGVNAIDLLRRIAGATNPEEADPASIRGACGRITTKGIYEDLIHCSADLADAEREIKLWFKPDELVSDIYPVRKVVRDGVEMLIWA
jgi:nucleoside-diphosphate kinase